MFYEMTMDEMIFIEGGGWQTVALCTVVGVIGVVVGPPAFVTGAVAVGAWYVGSALIGASGIAGSLGY